MQKEVKTDNRRGKKKVSMRVISLFIFMFALVGYVKTQAYLEGENEEIRKVEEAKEQENLKEEEMKESETGEKNQKEDRVEKEIFKDKENLQEELLEDKENENRKREKHEEIKENGEKGDEDKDRIREISQENEKEKIEVEEKIEERWEGALEEKVEGQYLRVGNNGIKRSQHGFLVSYDRKNFPLLKYLKGAPSTNYKYVVGDDQRKEFYWDGQGHWRAVYCLMWNSLSPDGDIIYDGQEGLGQEVSYVLVNGVRYWSETSVNPRYSTGNPAYDYYITQTAVHILHEGIREEEIERTLGYEEVYDRLMDLIADARRGSELYAEGYEGIRYSIERPEEGWSIREEGYATGTYYQHLEDLGVELGREPLEYLQEIQGDESGLPEGIEVRWEGEPYQSGFYFWMEKERYQELSMTGIRFEYSLKGNLPEYLSGWTYQPAQGLGYQNVTLLEPKWKWGEVLDQVELEVKKQIITPKGRVKIHKKGEKFIDAVEKEDGTYEFIYDIRGLEGAIFEVRTREDLYEVGDNLQNENQEEIRYPKGTVMERITTDEKGEAISSVDLPIGAYTLVEIQAPLGYLLGGEKEFDIREDETSTLEEGFLTVYLEVENKRIEKEIQVYKKDGEEGTPLKGAVFQLLLQEDLILPNEKVIKKGAVVKEGVTNDEGKLHFLNLPNGLYHVMETKAPKGYVRDLEFLEEVILEDTVNKEKEEMESSKMQEIECVNEKTFVQISKEDKSTKEVLKGAKLQLWKIGEEKEELIETWITQEEPTLFRGLAVGSYRLVEEEAPKGYSLAEDVLFLVEESKEIQKIRMFDEKIKTIETKEIAQIKETKKEVEREEKREQNPGEQRIQPKTGDTVKIGLFLTLCSGSFLLLGILILGQRKR